MKTPEPKLTCYCGFKVKLELVENEGCEACYEGTCDVCDATYSLIRGMDE